MMSPNYAPETTAAQQRVRGQKRARADERATEAMARVRERSRWFEPRLTRWGVEPHRVAEARGETPVAGLLADVCACRLRPSAAARNVHGSHGFHTHAHLTLNGSTSRARERGHFGAGLVLWLQELEDSEAFVNAMMRRPVTYGKFSSLSESLNGCHACKVH